MKIPAMEVSLKAINMMKSPIKWFRLQSSTQQQPAVCYTLCLLFRAPHSDCQADRYRESSGESEQAEKVSIHQGRVCGLPGVQEQKELLVIFPSIPMLLSTHGLA